MILKQMPKVYIANRSGHDYSPAEKYGELVYLTEGNLTVFDINKIYKLVVEQIEDSSSDDYILPSGLSSITNVAVQCLSLLHNGIVNYLIYTSDGRYEKRRLDVKGLLGLEDREEVR